MNDTVSLDWWRHQFYRQIKDFIGNPSEENETQLKCALEEYRKYFSERRSDREHDEHEWVMDFR